MEPHVVHAESIGDLIRGILGDLRALLKEEMALARLEIGQQVARVRTAGISFGMAAVALLLGGAFLLVAAALGIADYLGWPIWSGFMVVALVMMVLGAFAGLIGRKQLSQVHAVPENTMSSLKENAAWISKRLSSAQR
jgi:hypothetical protein